MKESTWSKFWQSMEKNHPTADDRLTPTIDGLWMTTFVTAFLGGNLLCKKEPKLLNAWVYEAFFFIGSSLEVEASNPQ
ncbi:hypothetical protein M9H77_02531 [Catharanthus roseus]|uniref:Uncharacterized protein n=1 Tax=Catharanthus roseus TaxID=4058 RepID=A0ACC0C8M8_CATRO|nr:hypothetical protein M9H77_02531 [Catharanthus roseus]